MFDTRPVNGKSSGDLVRSSQSQSSTELKQEEPSLREWLDLAVHWIRELVWRTRFWRTDTRDEK